VARLNNLTVGPLLMEVIISEHQCGWGLGSSNTEHTGA